MLPMMIFSEIKKKKGQNNNYRVKKSIYFSQIDLLGMLIFNPTQSEMICEIMNQIQIYRFKIFDPTRFDLFMISFCVI